ncbi:nuclear transport factor 2 family protein [Chryseobacterium aquaticum]|uniref:Nuclear transport factor 2 family protein n=1 Tax=Chryseobacterium aquaticum TaxID=452084 RepID=A0A848N5I4_9FLAO|nr:MULTISPECIES: nuclear transport factor 2 family protein [Chryseobacterium]NMR34185.1 nuclear transport factor 2 family protein [Chryseobacterium aquaticum]NRQ46260.1 nuclear transport factor 2 family protein [Chryseobacterium sp. C-204]
MNLPNIITTLVNAQNQYNSHSYADCFTDNAVVFDEGKTYNGKTEIENWISKANNEYKTIMKPLNYDEKENILSAEISGTFPGSPAILKYHFELNNGLIQSLKITG